MANDPAHPVPTLEEARKAAEVLETYGNQCYCETARATVTRGAKIGMALARAAGDFAVVDAAIEMLEDWNGHLAVAVLLAIEKGQGIVKREGRKLSITLPDHWAKL